MNRKRLTKAERMEVYQKYNGHCAYCGKEIAYKDMQVDHMHPLRLGGADDKSNYMPACRTCNHYKRANSLEGFRKLIANIPFKLKRDNYIYKVGLLYGLIQEDEKPIRFYFEERGQRMKRKNLKLLSKDDLIEIITSNEQLERTAFYKLIDMVGKKVLSIIDKQEECDITTSSGYAEYLKLEKEYKKWSKIQEDL